MDAGLRYRGREVTAADVVFISELIARYPTDSRRALSKKLCESWNWRQTNGALRDMVCRGLLLQLHRSGYIQLPPVRKVPRNPFVERRKPRASEVAVDTTPLAVALSQLRPLEFLQVRRTPQESLFNSLLEHYHYLGYTQPVRSVSSTLRHLLVEFSVAHCHFRIWV
jgi:hypothetical protein